MLRAGSGCGCSGVVVARATKGCGVAAARAPEVTAGSARWAAWPSATCGALEVDSFVGGERPRHPRPGTVSPTPPPGDGVPGTPQSRWAARPSCASVAGGRGNASRWGLETVQGVLDEPLPVPLGARCWDGNRGAPTTSRDRPRAEGPARPLGGCFAPAAAVDARCCGGLSDEGSGVAGGTGRDFMSEDVTICLLSREPRALLCERESLGATRWRVSWASDARTRGARSAAMVESSRVQSARSLIATSSKPPEVICVYGRTGYGAVRFRRSTAS